MSRIRSRKNNNENSRHVLGVTVAWSYTVNLIKRTQQRENTTVNIGLQQLTTVRNKTIDSILFFFMKCC